jgi:hypothetical protein
VERTYSKQRKNKDCKFLKNLDRSNKNYNKNDDTYKVQEQKKGKQTTIENRTIWTLYQLEIELQDDRLLLSKKKSSNERSIFFSNTSKPGGKKIKHNFSFQLARQII